MELLIQFTQLLFKENLYSVVLPTFMSGTKADLLILMFQPKCDTQKASDVMKLIPLGFYRNFLHGLFYESVMILIKMSLHLVLGKLTSEANSVEFGDVKEFTGDIFTVD